MEALCAPDGSEDASKRLTLGVVRAQKDDGAYDVELKGGKVVRDVRPEDLRLVSKGSKPRQQSPQQNLPSGHGDATPFEVGDRVEAK